MNASNRAIVADERAVVAKQRIIAAAQRKVERNDRLLQAEVEKLVRTRLRDQKILDRRAGLKVDPKKYLRTSAEISAEASALIEKSLEHLDQDRGDRARRPGESAGDWIARVSR